MTTKPPATDRKKRTHAITDGDYERAILAKLKHEFRFFDVRVEGTINGVKHYISGQYSRYKRQLDVAVYRRDESRPFLFVDAKRQTRTVTVKEVETFLGMIDDVGAKEGILVAPNGFTKGARNRLSNTSTRAVIMTVDEALEHRWLLTAQEIFPLDWTFHEVLASSLRNLNEPYSPEKVAGIIEDLEPLPFEEWESFVNYALAFHPAEAERFLTLIAKHHHDEGWRFNSILHLMDSGLLNAQLRSDLLAKERDPEIVELLKQ